MTSQQLLTNPPAVNAAPALHAASTAAPRRRPSWHLTGGYVVALAAASAGVVEAYASARHSNGQGHFALFWAAFALAFVMTLLVATHASTRLWLRLTALAGFGVFTFLPKFLMSRNGPVYYDEYGHWRHANDIAASGHLAVSSTFLPILRYYPGLDALAAGLHRLTGLSTWHAGQVIVLVSHCGVLLIIVLLTRSLGLSDRAAALAALVYALNSSYMYFDTDFSYESLGLPLAFLTITLVVFARRADSGRAAVLWCAAAAPVGSATILTHHISALTMLAVLVTVAALIPARSHVKHSMAIQWGPFAVTAFLVTGFILWVSFVAPATFDYLAPHVRAAATQVTDLLTGGSGQATYRGGQIVRSARHVPFAGSGAPAYEVVAAFVAPVITGVATLAALVQAWSDRRNIARLVLLTPFFLLTVLYFASLPLALTVGGGEAGHRTWAFAYLGVAVLAVSAAPTWRRWSRRLGDRSAKTLLVAALLTLAVGNVAAGLNVTYRFPGPYEFGTDTRSTTPELMQLAQWADAHLTPGAKVITDRFTGEILTGYSRLQVPSPAESWTYRIYQQGDDVTPSVRAALAAAKIRYWVLDTRIGRQTPVQSLFLGYAGRSDVNAAALAQAGTSGSLLHLVHRTANYEVFEVTP